MAKDGSRLISRSVVLYVEQTADPRITMRLCLLGETEKGRKKERKKKWDWELVDRIKARLFCLFLITVAGRTCDGRGGLDQLL